MNTRDIFVLATTFKPCSFHYIFIVVQWNCNTCNKKTNLSKIKKQTNTIKYTKVTLIAGLFWIDNKVNGVKNWCRCSWIFFWRFWQSNTPLKLIGFWQTINLLVRYWKCCAVLPLVKTFAIWSTVETCWTLISLLQTFSRIKW
jgi:hypothetical protein